MHTSKNSKLNLITDVYKLRVVLFWEILRTGNILLIDLNYKEGNKYTESEKRIISQTWANLYDEVFKLRDSGKARAILQEKTKQAIFEHKIMLILKTNEHLNSLLMLEGDISKHTFNNLLIGVYDSYKAIDSKIKINPSKDIRYNINIVNRALKSFENTYNFSIKKTKTEDSKEGENIHETVVKIEQILNRTLSDIDSMTVPRWIACEKLADKIIKESKNTKRGKLNK